MTAKVITDREIQLAASAHAGDADLAEMLHQLIDFRKYARAAVAEHDFSSCYNRGISELIMYVNRSGCEWWLCDQVASTSRLRDNGCHEYVRLCCAHADEGEVKGFWSEWHSDNVRLKQEDLEMRAWRTKWEAERAAELAAAAATTAATKELGDE